MYTAPTQMMCLMVAVCWRAGRAQCQRHRVRLVEMFLWDLLFPMMSLLSRA